MDTDNHRHREGSFEETWVNRPGWFVPLEGTHLGAKGLCSCVSMVIQTFSTLSFPSRPAGRNSRMRIKIAKAMASR